jgi:gamma-glutamyltranspeptidase/glutathione hydrolase
MAEIGGHLTRADLAAHRSEWVDPVSSSYRGVEVWELPPNGQGIAALQILNVLEGYDIAGAGFGSADHLHWFVEAKKLAFADRARYYADLDFADVPVQELISEAYADRQRARIRPDRAMRSVDPGNPALQDGDTVYLAAADRSGLMISLIQSNYRGMGSGVCPPGLGFGLQDRGELFDLTAGRPNSYAPGKRPFHTIIPAFLTEDGQPLCAFGVMGGATQPQAHAWVVMNLVDFGMNLQEAGDAPRVVHRGSSQPTGEVMTDGGTVYLETGFGWEARRALENRGHRLGTTVGGYGGYQAVMRDGARGVLIGASESRKDGHAAGF